MSKPVFIIAQQRSGTNLLRRSLATTGDFLDADEIFDPKTEAYWAFHLSQVQENHSLASPTNENRMELFERYLNGLLDNDKPFTLIDIKYNSTHLLDGMWHSPMMVPELIQWLARKNYPVIHLVRKNCLESYVSLLVGQHTGNWVVGSSSEGADPVRLNLEPDETIFQIQRRVRELKRFRRYLTPTNHLEIEYESLIDPSGEFARNIAETIYKFVGLESVASIQVPTRKTGCPVQETIENFETDILPALRRHDLDKYASSGTRQAVAPTNSSATRTGDPVPKVIAIRPRTYLSYAPRIQRSEPKSKPVFVIAMQRSGTNLFRKSLATSNYFDDLNEIFDPFQQLFWPFRQRMIDQRAGLAVPVSRNQLEIFESFLDEKLNSEKPFTFVDVKYNSTQHLNSLWYHPGTRPLLIEWLVEQQCPVIHLVRENIFENYVSNVVAHQSRVWLVEESNPIAECSVRLNAAETVRSIQTFQAQIDVFRKWLQPTNHIELTYESLIDPSGGLSREVIGKTCRLVGIDQELDISIPTRKTGRSLDQVVENFESEIAPALIKNGYADWLSKEAA